MPLVTGLCEGNSPVTGEFPVQRASNAENVSIWWRHHDITSALVLQNMDTLDYYQAPRKWEEFVYLPHFSGRAPVKKDHVIKMATLMLSKHHLSMPSKVIKPVFDTRLFSSPMIDRR